MSQAPFAGMLTKAETAALLGKSQRSIDRYVKDGMPVIKVGGMCLFRRASIEAWFLSRETGAVKAGEGA